MRNSILAVLMLALAAAHSYAQSDCVDINSAPAVELRRIIHIDTVRAQEIIRLRPFSSVDDLKRVRGIADKRLADIKEQDIACVRPRATPALRLGAARPFGAQPPELPRRLRGHSAG